MEKSKLEEVAIKLLKERFDVDAETTDEIVTDVVEILENCDQRDGVLAGDENALEDFGDLVEALLFDEDEYEDEEDEEEYEFEDEDFDFEDADFE